jgi:hypothetical protein
MADGYTQEEFTHRYARLHQFNLGCAVCGKGLSGSYTVDDPANEYCGHTYAQIFAAMEATDPEVWGHLEERAAREREFAAQARSAARASVERQRSEGVRPRKERVKGVGKRKLWRVGSVPKLELYWNEARHDDDIVEEQRPIYADEAGELYYDTGDSRQRSPISPQYTNVYPIGHDVLGDGGFEGAQTTTQHARPTFEDLLATIQ